MKSLIISVLLLLVTNSALGRETEHIVLKDETPWFLALLYYGNGNDFRKIVRANDWKSPEEMKEGMVIKIIDPSYLKTQSGFADRYAELWEQRAVALEKKEAGRIYSQRLPAQSSKGFRKVVIPIEKIRQNDNLHGLPFTAVTDPNQSVSDLARQELQRESSAGSRP